MAAPDALSARVGAAAYVLMCAAVAAFGVPVSAELLAPEPDWLSIAALHGLNLVVLLIFAMWPRIDRLLARHRAGGARSPRRRPPQDAAWRLYLLITYAALGTTAALATLAAFLLHQYHLRHSRPFEEWYRELFPERGRRLYERIYDELVLTERQRQSPSEVIPFADVINYGTRDQKQTAISMMSRYFQPPFAPVLKRALDDPDNSVRIQAATAITNLESRFSERVIELERRLGDEPSPRDLRELARHLDRYAFSGLLDDDRTRRVRERATAVYRSYVDLEPGDQDACIAVGRLLMRARDMAGAQQWLAAARERFGPSTRLDTWLLEAHFATGDFAAARELAASIAARDAGSDSAALLSDSARLWAGLPAAVRS